ncbi:MAG: hypothetical protein FJ291_13685 [Planctomycetes bacterium]|nr:hypothetical protein [Planctomycetota bacterium]
MHGDPIPPELVPEVYALLEALNTLAGGQVPANVHANRLPAHLQRETLRRFCAGVDFVYYWHPDGRSHGPIETLMMRIEDAGHYWLAKQRELRRAGAAAASTPTAPEGELSLPMSLREIASRLGNMGVDKCRSNLEGKGALVRESRQQWRVDYSKLDKTMRERIRTGRPGKS